MSDAHRNRGFSAEDSDALDVRQSLLETSLVALFEAYDEAVAAEMDSPVLFLVDCEDSLGSQIARAWHGDEAVEDAIALEQFEHDGEDVTTVLVRAFPFGMCRGQVPEFFPYLEATFAEPPPEEGFLSVVVAEDGATTFTVPRSARPE